MLNHKGVPLFAKNVVKDSNMKHIERFMKKLTIDHMNVDTVLKVSREKHSQ